MNHASEPLFVSTRKKLAIKLRGKNKVKKSHLVFQDGFFMRS